MQSPTDSSDLSHISPAQRYCIKIFQIVQNHRCFTFYRYEEEIEIYSGDDPLSVWERFVCD